MDTDLLATMGIGGFGKLKKKPPAGPPPQQQARHDAARRPPVSLPMLSLCSSPYGSLPIFQISKFPKFPFYDEFYALVQHFIRPN